ncbi:MAG: cation transporter [Clostridia bacterium]|nr:cation transporter [Clostridia bacterium]
MKTQRNIFIAFTLNLLFSILEFVGGILTGSVAILSDSIHDFGDATSIGISYFFEKKSKRKADDRYTCGYARYSVLGGCFTTVILLVGSGIVLYNAIGRCFNPVSIDYDGMLVLALVGLLVNLLATHLTHGGASVNQKAVHLHMLEDALGWIVVLIGAIVMRFTDFYLLDPILSIGLAVFIVVCSFKNLKEVVEIFLMKKPKHVDLEKLKASILQIDGVIEVARMQVWTTDGEEVVGMLRVVVRQYDGLIKNAVKEQMHEHGIDDTTVEMEIVGEKTWTPERVLRKGKKACAHHHHHHHH